MGGLTLSGCIAQPPSPQPPSDSWIPDEATESQIRDAMKKHRVPGVGMAIVADGALVWEGSYGLANMDTGQPIQRNTLFQAASLTKPLFAYVVLRLVDAGQIDLDEKLIETHRPEDLGSSPWCGMITVRHVLTHQTGLPNWRSTEEESIPLEPAFEPGTGYTYSGEAFHWLQQVCELKTDLGLHELVNRYLLTPAKLTDMAMLWLPERDEREVYGHIVDDEDDTAKLSSLQFAREHGWRLNEVAEKWGVPMTQWQSKDQRAAHAEMRPYDHPRLKSRPLWHKNRPGSALIDSASSLRTTPGDYARFLTLLMKPVDLADGGLSKTLRDQMLSIQTDVSEPGPKRPVGYSWALELVEGGVAFDHWGFNQRQYISMGLGDTSNQKGIVIMTNGARGNRFMDEIGPIITGIPYHSFVI